MDGSWTLVFYYLEDGVATDAAPSPIGYGASLHPTGGEANYAAVCTARGYWPYALMSRVYEWWPGESGLVVDEARTAAMVGAWARARRVSKVLLEPHVKVRWGLGREAKVRFHGCHAVQHDDHVHVQVR